MSNHHTASPEQWAYAETCAPEDFAGYSCILELRDRIEALEVGQQPLVNYAPVKPEYRDKLDRLIEQDRSNPQQLALVERVADAIAAQATSAGIVNDRPARAAIREVAAWLRSEQARVAGNNSAFASLLEQEANR
jgi:hypothetical protein